MTSCFVLFFVYTSARRCYYENEIAKWNRITQQQREDIDALKELILRKNFERSDFHNIPNSKFIINEIIGYAVTNTPYVIHSYEYLFDKKNTLIDIVLSGATIDPGVAILHCPKNLKEQCIILKAESKVQQKNADVFIQLIKMKDYTIEDFELLEDGVLGEDSYVINGYIFIFDKECKLIEVSPREDAAK